MQTISFLSYLRLSALIGGSFVFTGFP